MADSAEIIGKGMSVAMDQIYRSLLGDAFANAKSGKNVTGKDVANSALTVGLNALPLGGAGAAAKGAQAASKSSAVARALATQAAKNPLLQSRVSSDTLAQMARSGDTRFKNMFELGDFNTPNIRTAAERSALGIAENAPASARPNLYGVVTPRIPFVAASVPSKAGDSVVAQTRARLSPNNPNLENYIGDANVVFDPKALSRATMTAGDTGATLGGGGRAVEVSKRNAKDVADRFILDTEYGALPNTYMEAQMYGADLAKAKKVLVPSKEAKRSLQSAFKDAGVKVPVKVDKGAAKEAALKKKLASMYEQQRRLEPEA